MRFKKEVQNLEAYSYFGNSKILILNCLETLLDIFWVFLESIESKTGDFEAGCNQRKFMLGQNQLDKSKFVGCFKLKNSLLLDFIISNCKGVFFMKHYKFMNKDQHQQQQKIVFV